MANSRTLIAEIASVRYDGKSVPEKIGKIELKKGSCLSHYFVNRT